MRIDPKYTDFISLFLRLKYIIISPLVPFYLRNFSGIKIGKSCHFAGCPIVLCRQGASIVIGEQFKATSNSRNNPAGVSHPVILSAFGQNAVLKIGDNVGVTGVSINCWNRIEIEQNVMIGAGTAIWDTDFHPTDSLERLVNPGNGKTAPILIKKNTFIGARVLILKGVTIGENCVVAAGAVINKNVPDNSIVYGNPMIIKKI
jgi:acetyltransferase-like isoleucine patch superfamily enzyme